MQTTTAPRFLNRVPSEHEVGWFHWRPFCAIKAGRARALLALVCFLSHSEALSVRCLVPGTWSIGWSLKLWAFVVFGKDHRTGELSSSLAPTGEAFFG